MGKPCGWRALEKLHVKSFCKNSAGLQKILLQCVLAVRLFNITSNYRANPSKPRIVLFTVKRSLRRHNVTL